MLITAFNKSTKLHMLYGFAFYFTLERKFTISTCLFTMLCNKFYVFSCSNSKILIQWQMLWKNLCYKCRIYSSERKKFDIFHVLKLWYGWLKYQQTWAAICKFQSLILKLRNVPMHDRIWQEQCFKMSYEILQMALQLHKFSIDFKCKTHSISAPWLKPPNEP